MALTTYQQQRLQAMIDAALADQNVSDQEAADVYQWANNYGAGPDILAQMSGLNEADIAATIANIDPNSPLLNQGGSSAPPPTGGNPGGTPVVTGGNTGGSPAPAPTPTPQPTTQQPPVTQNPGTYQPPAFSLPPIESQGNIYGDLFGNNPGALGFNDLNPLVTSAENTQQAAIPEFLKPFLAQSADASMGGMAGLTRLLARDNALTSPFNDLQNQSQQMALDVAGGAGGFVPQAQAAISEIADSSDIVGLFERAQRLLEQPAGLGGLNTLSQGSSGNPAAMSTLEATARGDFLYGSPGFDEAVQASIRAARPGIINTFSQGGSGAINGGLAQIGMQQAASDAFARQFAQERGNMLGASNALNQFDLNNRGQQMNALNSIIGANQNAGQIYSNMANADRSRQFQAAQLLPQMGLLGSQIVGQVGAQRQGQEEREKLGQIQAMQSLLDSAFGNINPNALFGNISSVQTNQNRGAGALGGALAGAQLGSMIPGLGTGIGAIGGGLLGAFG